MPIPVNFEEKVKLPAANGYPYSLRSDDLMKNFAWCDLLPSEETDEIRIELDEVVGVTQQHKQRRLRVATTGIVPPWKVTDNGDGTVAIAAGFILGHYFTHPTPNWNDDTAVTTANPTTVVLGAGASYSGGDVEITGTKYIYALLPRNGTSKLYSESNSFDGASGLYVETELGDDIEPATTDTVIITAQDNSPDTYLPDSSVAAVCIAKAVNAGSSITITQYVHHNPTVFIPIVNTIAYVLPP